MRVKPLKIFKFCYMKESFVTISRLHFVFSMVCVIFDIFLLKLFIKEIPIASSLKLQTLLQGQNCVILLENALKMSSDTPFESKITKNQFKGFFASL